MRACRLEAQLEQREREQRAAEAGAQANRAALQTLAQAARALGREGIQSFVLEGALLQLQTRCAPRSLGRFARAGAHLPAPTGGLLPTCDRPRTQTAKCRASAYLSRLSDTLRLELRASRPAAAAAAAAAPGSWAALQQPASSSNGASSASLDGDVSAAEGAKPAGRKRAGAKQKGGKGGKRAGGSGDEEAGGGAADAGEDAGGVVEREQITKVRRLARRTLNLPVRWWSGGPLSTARRRPGGTETCVSMSLGAEQPLRQEGCRRC